MTIESKQTHCGQYKPYGDFVREWEIATDNVNSEEILNYCFKNLYKHRLPEKTEYMKNIRYGTGEKSGDAGYYFAGYYTLFKTESGFKFIVSEPYAD